jgi:hypothetical protein
MKIIFTFLVLFFAYKPFAWAADECAANTSQYTAEGLKKRISVFDEKSPKIKKVLPSKIVKYGFEDRAELKNGVMVTYKTGGCAHYAFSFVFTGQKLAVLKGEERMTRALILLKNLNLKDEHEKEIMLKALQEAQSSKVADKKGSYNWSCGDAQCSVVDEGKHKVEIGYDFPL